MNELNHLLESSSAMLVERDSGESVRCSSDESGALVVGAVFEQLLAEIVAEGISHELADVRTSLSEDDLNLLGLALLELALKVSTAVLILAELVEATTVGLERNIGEASFIIVVTTAGTRSSRILSFTVGTIAVDHAEDRRVLVAESLHTTVQAVLTERLTIVAITRRSEA